MRILGIDPSLNNFGIALGTIKKGKLSINHINLCQTRKNEFSKIVGIDDVLRANKIINFVSPYLNKVDVVIAEIPTGSQSARSARTSGICLGILGMINDLYSVSPNDVKKIVGKNDKKEIIKWATLLHPLLQWTGQNKDEHCADAIAVIYAGIKKHGLLGT